MDNEQYQKELFEFEKPKRSFPALGSIFSKGDFENRFVLTLTSERMVFVLIGIIMLMVIVFALGVEQGKSIQREAPKVIRTTTAPKPLSKTLAPGAPTLGLKAPVKPVKAAALPAAATVVKPQTPQTKIQQPQISQAAQAAPFTIVAATFARQETALFELNHLKSAGLDAYIYKSDPYFQLCVGRYTNKDEPKKVLSKVRQVFKDAYIKYRQ